MKKQLSIISCLVVLFLSSCQKNHGSIINDNLSEDTTKISSSKIATPPLSIYSPVGCNYPSYLGRAFAVKNWGGSTPFPASSGIPRFVITHNGNAFLTLNAGVNFYTHEWEVGVVTTGWPIGNYTVKFMPNPATPTYLLGSYSFTLVSPGSVYANCW